MLENQFLSLSSLSRLSEVKAKFTANITFIGACFLFVYTFIYFYFEAYAAAFACLFSLTTLIPLILYNLSIKKILFARILTVITTVFIVAFSAVALRNQANTEYYFLPTMMLSLLLFEPNQKNAIAFSLFLPIFGWISTHLQIPDQFQNSHWFAPHDFPYFYLSIGNFVGALLLTYTFLKFYSHSIFQAKEIEIENEQKLMHSSKLVSMGQLAGGIAHEINNPLAIILGRTQLLKTKLETTENIDSDKMSILQNLGKIESTALLITKIIKGLNAFSRNSDNDPFEKTSVKKIIDYALELCEDRIKLSKVLVRTNYEPDQTIMCREFQIAQVIINLVNNSIDAIEPLPEKWILIDFKTSHGWVEISITDSGDGINPQLLDKIMLPFFTTKKIGKGIGLGLSISKSIVEAHGGLLIYDDRNVHTRFTIKLQTT